MHAQFMERQARCKASGSCTEELKSWDSDFVMNVNPLLPHTDGYVYGDHMPDVIFLHSEQPARRGGENFLIDGEAILRELEAADPRAAHLARLPAAALAVPVGAARLPPPSPGRGVRARHADDPRRDLGAHLRVRRGEAGRAERDRVRRPAAPRL